MLKFADKDLLAFAPLARIAESGMATIKEINESWNFEDMQLALAYLEMKSAMDKAIHKLYTAV